MTDTMPDFSITAVRQPKPFKIDEEIYYVSGSQPAGILFDMMGLEERKGMGEQVSVIMRILESSLIPESYERFMANMKKPNGITLDQVLQVMRWTMEQYADRPTQPALSSSGPQDSIGTSSTVGVPTGASIPSHSAPTGF